MNVLRNADCKVFVSAASAMEMTTKHRLGKLSIVDGFINQLSETIVKSNFDFLAIEFNDAVLAGQMGFSNRDPFDRLLIAQAINRNLTLISNEAVFDSTGVTRLWK